MDTHEDRQTEQRSEDSTGMSNVEQVPTETNGASKNAFGLLPSYQSTPTFKRAFMPSTFKLDETPEERDRRIRETRAMLKSLLATTPEEVEEQRETWKILRAALNEGRPTYAKLFPDDE